MSSQASASKKGDTEYRKPRADVFTMLLVLALLAILFGITLLWAHMKQVFDYRIKGGPTPTAAVSMPMEPRMFAG